MNNTVLITIKENNLIKRHDNIIVALSGGADSMALIEFLMHDIKEYNLNISAFHLNHMLRGEESDRDELFVKNYCIKNSINCYIEKVDITKAAKQKKLGIEEYSRNARYELLEKIAKEKNAKIATAHTLSDKLETFILNFTRGTALPGLCSIPVIRGNIIRPLIDCTRKQIEQYCEKNSIQYITDSTNNKDIYTRNKVRLNIIPHLKEINPNIENNIKNLFYYINQDNKYLDKIAKDKFDTFEQKNNINLEDLKKVDKPILYRLINLILIENNLHSNNKNIRSIEDIIEKQEGKINISKNTYIQVKDKRLTISIVDEKINLEKYNYFEYEVKNNLLIKIDNIYYEFIISNNCQYNKKIKNFRKISNLYMDYDKMKGKLKLRQRKNSDKIKTHKSKYNKYIKKIFNEKKIPIEKRYKLPVLEDESGIIWVDEIGVNQRVITDKLTSNYMIITKYEEL